MNRTEFDARLHAHLDARREPLDDPELVAWLEAHPEHLAAFAQLLADARDVVHVRPAPRRVPRVLLLVAAGATAAATILLLALPDAAPAATRSRIVAASLEELPPRAHAAAVFTVTETLCASPTAHFESFQLRSERR